MIAGTCLFSRVWGHGVFLCGLRCFLRCGPLIRVGLQGVSRESNFRLLLFQEYNDGLLDPTPVEGQCIGDSYERCAIDVSVFTG